MSVRAVRFGDANRTSKAQKTAETATATTKRPTSHPRPAATPNHDLGVSPGVRGLSGTAVEAGCSEASAFAEASPPLSIGPPCESGAMACVLSQLPPQGQTIATGRFTNRSSNRATKTDELAVGGHNVRDADCE